MVFIAEVKGTDRWLKSAGSIGVALCLVCGSGAEAAASGKVGSALRGTLSVLGNSASGPMSKVNGSAGGYEGDVNEASSGDSATGSAANLFSSGGASGSESSLPSIAPSKLPLAGLERTL